VVSPALTSGLLAYRSAWRVSIAGSVRSAGANNWDHCARNTDAGFDVDSIGIFKFKA
jgi:hypothetical protein